MSELLLDRAGRRRSPATMPGFHAGLRAESAAVEATGAVWTTILEIADRHDAATIVMGSRGLTGMRSLLLGSVSSAVVHHAARPALVVPRPDDHH